MVLSKTAQGVMCGEENEQMGVGEDWVCCDGENEYGGEEDEVLWPHHPEKPVWRKDSCKGRWEASRERTNQQRPGSRI